MKLNAWITFGVCLLVLLLIGGSWLGIIPTVKIGDQEPIKYSSVNSGIEFNYPNDFAVQDISQSNEKIRIINLMPKVLKNKFDPQFIEIISYEMPEETLSQAAQDFLPDANKDDFIDLQREGFDAIEYSQIKGAGEESIYTFFAKDERLSIIIFRVRRFDKNNPLVLIDNSMYFESYREVVDSFNFI